MYLGTNLHERNVLNLKIAVVSDVISEEGYFPIWHRYYSSVVGSENIFLFSYNNKIGNSIVLSLPYTDGMRMKIITHQVEKLLEIYDIVVRVDVDEFLVPMEGTLQDYLANFNKDYATAYGFDVFQSGEQPLDLEIPIMKQRNLMYATAFMNKTCITRTIYSSILHSEKINVVIPEKLKVF